MIKGERRKFVIISKYISYEVSIGIFIGPRCTCTDVTLADEDTNSILADNAKRAIQGNEAMQVMWTYASGAIWWPNLQLMQVVSSGGHICNYCKWRHLEATFATHAGGAIW